MFTHNLDPILFNLGIISIRWYSLAYIFGILIGWWYGKKIILKRFAHIGKKFDIEEFDNLITYLILAIVIGGRLGYITFYNSKYYFNNPFEIFKVWEGGMSFHGALAGIVLTTLIFSAKKKIDKFFLLDIIACVAPIGIFFGRVANFINGELVGKISSVSWGVIFPKVDMMPRHPSQLYEAFLEGILLFVMLNIKIYKNDYRVGTCSYMFLILYGIFRIFSEYFREPDVQVGYIFDLFTMGTILSTVMILCGLFIFFYLKKNENQS